MVAKQSGPTNVWYENGVKAGEVWYRGNKAHRDAPALIHYQDGQILEEFWYCQGKKHRADGPAKLQYENGQIVKEGWYRHGRRHRTDGPAEIHYEDGKKIREWWYQYGGLGGNTLAYVWLADVDDVAYRFISFKHLTIDEFRDVVKGPLALQLMRPLPIPIRQAIYEHYCLQ